MASQTDDTRQLYDNLKEDGYEDIGTIEEFRESVADRTMADQLYNNLKEDGYEDLGTSEEFYLRLNPQGDVRQPVQQDTLPEGQDAIPKEPAEPAAKVDAGLADAAQAGTAVGKAAGKPAPGTLPGTDEWRRRTVDLPGDNPYNGRTFGEVYDSVIQDYGRNLANPDIDPYAEARAQIMQAGITDDMKPDEADRLALDIREGYANRYASNGSREMVAALPDQVPNIDDLMDSQWYTRDLQGRISHEAARLGLRRENYVNYYVKPHIAKALSDRYGFDAGSAGHIAKRLLSQEDHTADQIRRREAVGIIAANAGERIDEQFQKIQQAADEQTRAEAEGSMMTPFGSAGQSMGAAVRNWQASDPEAVWQQVKPFFDEMGSWLGIVGNQQLFEQVSQMADSENIPVNTYIDQYVLPAYADTVKREFERIAVEREMPKNTFDYVMDKVGQSLVGTVGRWMVESKARMRAQDEALQMTDAGQNTDYTPGYGARVAGGTAELMADMALPYGGPFGLTAKIASRPVQGMAQALITDGWRPLAARMAQSSAGGSLSLGVFEGLKGAVRGGVNPEGYESVLAEDKRNAFQILSDMVEGGFVHGLPSTVTGAFMVGGPVGQRISNGRGLLGNIMGWGAQVGVDAGLATAASAAQQLPKIAAGDVTRDDLKREFYDNAGTFLALGLHSKAKEFASLAEGGRSVNGVEFTREDVDRLEDVFSKPLREIVTEIDKRQGGRGYIQKSQVDEAKEREEAVGGAATALFGNTLRSHAIPRDLKVRLCTAFSVPVPEYVLKPEVLESTDKALTQSVDLGWQEMADYEYNRPGGVADKVKAGKPLTDYELTLRLLYQDNKQWNEVVRKVLAGDEISADEARLLAAYNERISIIQRDYYQREKERLTEEFERENGLKKGTIARMLEDVREGRAVEDPETLDKFNDMMREFGESLDKFKTARDEAVNTGQDQETPAEEAPNINKVPEETATKTDEVPAEETPTRIDFRLNDEVTVTDDDGTVTNGFVASVPAVSDGTFAIQTDDGRVIYRNAEYMQTHVTSHNGTEIAANIPKPKPEPETPAKEEAQADGGIAAKYRIPLDKDANPDYERARPEDTFDALVEEFGEENAAALVKSEISDAKKRMPKPRSAEPVSIPGGLSMAEKTMLLRQQMERRKALEDEERANSEREQARIDYWNSVLEVPKTRKAEADRAARREKMMTREGREELLSEAKTAQQRAAIAKEIYGDYFNENTGEPDTVEELVSMLLPYGKLNWEGYERGINHVRGLQEELGSQHTRGLSKDKGTAGFNSYLAKKGEGESLDEIVHEMYEDSTNLIGDEHRFTTEEIKDAVIDMLLSAEKPTDIRDYIVDSRIVTAEKTLRAELEREREDEEAAAGKGDTGLEGSHPIGHTSTPEQIAAEEGRVNTDPTDGQKEAGNYQKGHVSIDGYDITIENPKGSVRRGTDAKGNKWETEMHNSYGYIRGTEGVDGDHIDVFLSDNPADGKVFVVDQINPETGEFDEHKVMYGFADAAEAVKAYLSNYSDGWKGMGAVTGISREAFKEWVQSSHRKTKPFREYAIAKSKGETEDGKLPFEPLGDEAAPFHTASPEDRPVEDVEMENALRDAVVDHLRSIGVEVSTGWQEGQRILDEYNGNGQVKKMGTSTRKRQNDILEYLKDRSLSEQQKQVADAFGGVSDRITLSVKSKDGKSRNIMFRQGNENRAGVKHSVFRHYNTESNGYTADEVTMIPEIIADGNRKQDQGNRVSYKYEKDGITYTVTTEARGKKELFTNFYTNKKPSVAERGTSNTDNRHVQPQQTDSGAKVQQNPETSKDSGRKFFKTPDGHAYGFTYKGKIYIDPRIATAETPIHEYGHLWAEMKRQTAPEEWSRIKDVLLKDRLVEPFIEKVRRDYPELAGEGTEEAFVEEVLTQFSGHHGAGKLRQMAEEIKNDLGGDATAETIAEAAVRRVKSVLNEFWKGICDMMGWQYTSAEDIADRILSDMLNGVNPRERMKEAMGERKDIAAEHGIDESLIREYEEGINTDSEEVIADLSEPGQSDAAADASKPQIPNDNGREPINADAQVSSSAGKDTKNTDTIQEKTEKSSDEAPKFQRVVSPEPEKSPFDSIMEEVERRKNAPKFQKDVDGRDPVTRILDEVDDRRETARLQKAPLSEEDDIARKVYEDAVAKSTLKFQEAWQDSMISLKKLQEAIEAETGNRAAGAEDACAFENRMHGRAKNIGERFDTMHYRPMLRAFDELTKDRGWDNSQTMDYLISKHGLERNGYYAFRDAVREKLHDAIEEEKKKLDSDYSKKKVDDAYYAGRRAELEERERNVKAEAEEAIAGFRDTLAYKRAKEDYENGTIGYSEYLRRLEDLMRAFSTREKPRKDGDGRVLSTNYYDDHARDYSGLTETFAKEMYDEAQKTKRMAQRTVDPDRKKEIWKEYDAKMRQAYITARQLAEDAVFSGEKQDVPTPLKDTAAGRLWDRINDATKETLRISYESGMMDRSTYNKVRDMFDYYIPLRGWDENKASDVYSYIGKENVFSPAVKKTWGRTSKAENPLAYIGNIATSTILSGQRNLMKQHFLNYVMNNPTSLTSVSESWYENVGTKENPVWELRTADTAGKSADEIASIVSDFNQEMAEKQANGMAMPVRGRLRMDLNATKGQKAEHVVEVQRNGHTYQIYINGDPKAAQALNGTAAKAVSRISDTYVGKKLGELNRSMAAFFTSKNPAFVVSNLSRDLNMAGASVAVNEGAEYNARFVKNVAKVLTPRMGESSSWVKASKQPTGMMPDLMRKYKKGTLDEGDDTERYFKEFMDEGGETGFVNMLSVDSFKEKMQDEIGHMQGSNLFGRGGKECSIRKGLRLMGDTFEFYNRCAEDATRFIVYMTSRETGKTMEESIADAKDVTLNFNRKGTGGKGNAEMRDLFIFVNPAIQALANMYRMGKGHPLKLGAVATSFMAGGAFMPVLNQWLLNMFGDDDDKQAYWNLPPWVRKNNLVMWIPGTRNFLTIPLAQEFRVFYGTGEMISSAVMDHPTENMGLEVASSVADLVPINPTGNGGNLLVDFMPTGVQPLVQVGENVDFTGRPIWKENEGNKLDPMYTKAYAGTPKWMVKVSEKLNDWTGGNVGRKGVVEEKAPVWGEYINNPAVWNHLLQGYLGGMYNTIAKAFDTAYTLMKGELPDVYQVPVLNRFVNRPSERENAGLLGEEYWDLVRERDVLMNELGKNAQAAADGDAEAQKRVDEIMASDDFKRAQVIGHYKKIMDDLRKGEKAAGQTESESGARDMIRQSIGLYKQQMEDELKAVGGGTDPLEQAYKAFDAATTFTERNRFRQKIKDLSSRPKARKPADEAVEKALRYTKDEEDESREGSEKYLMEATSDDLRSDAEISLLKRQAKEAKDEATYKDLDNLQKKLGRWKNKLGEESRDYGTYSMQLIREHRQDGIDEARKALENPVEAPKDQP